jgi:hypothetical protein
MHRHQKPSAAALTIRLRAALFGAVLAVAALALLAPAAMAASTYVGGPRTGDYPLYGANDHSVYTLRIEIPAVGVDETPWLLPETQYYVKIRLSPSTGPSGSANRGFTWNPATQAWAQERADWAQFPTITSDASGAYIPGNQWFAFKFGDVTKSGTYYILVSLQPVDAGAGTTMNNLAPPAVTVTDPAGVLVGATPSFWVHNGVATGTSAAKRVDAVPSGETGILSLSRTEANQVDEDGNGVVDDEDYGPAGAAGDFSLAVPSGIPFDVRLQSLIWPPLLTAPALQNGHFVDVDIAYGALDQTPPSAVAGLAAEAGDATVGLTWNASAEEEGVTEYRVYRWTDPVPIDGVIQYSSQPLLLATTTAAGYQDDDVVNGEDYYYLVRAVDGATNVGPRSEQVAAAPRLGTTLSIGADATIVPYKGSTTLTVHLADALGAPVAGRLVDVQSSIDGVTWTTFASIESDGGTVMTPALTRALKFRATWAGAGEYAGSTSAYVLVKPKVALGRPNAPDSVARYVKFTVSGTLKPRHSPGWNKAVKLYCYKKDATTGKYVLKKTAWCKTVDYLSYSKYKVTIYLGSRGVWKLRAFAPEDKQHAATWSTSQYMRVK